MADLDNSPLEPVELAEVKDTPVAQVSTAIVVYSHYIETLKAMLEQGTGLLKSLVAMRDAIEEAVKKCEP